MAHLHRPADINVIKGRLVDAEGDAIRALRYRYLGNFRICLFHRSSIRQCDLLCKINLPVRIAARFVAELVMIK